MIIDAHVHCGIQDKFPPQSYDDYFSVISGSGIMEAVMFPPVMEVYDRYDPDFTDTDNRFTGYSLFFHLERFCC